MQLSELAQPERIEMIKGAALVAAGLGRDCEDPDAEGQWAVLSQS